MWLDISFLILTPAIKAAQSRLVSFFTCHSFLFLPHLFAENISRFNTTFLLLALSVLKGQKTGKSKDKIPCKDSLLMVVRYRAVISCQSECGCLVSRHCGFFFFSVLCLPIFWVLCSTLSVTVACRISAPQPLITHAHRYKPTKHTAEKRQEDGVGLGSFGQS